VTVRQTRHEQSPHSVRAELAARLRRRTPEIEQAILDRITELAEPDRDADPGYVAGLRGAIKEGVAYGLEIVEKGVEAPIPAPPEAARQARRAVRTGVRLDIVLRRYAAGSRSLEEFILADAGNLPSQVLCQVLSDQGLQIDRLMEFVSAEYGDELQQASRSLREMEADRIVRLLEGSSRVCPEINYDFDRWHVGMIMSGRTETTRQFVRSIAERSACQLLEVPHRESATTWAWLGYRDQPSLPGLVELLEEGLPDGINIAIGEGRKGLDGWRQTNREARAALQVMHYQTQPITRCRDVILVAAILRDPSLATSLIETFLAPLDGRSDSGKVLRETLHMYFQKDQNAKTTAAALGVDRHTVERRLRSVEERLGQTLETCSAQLLVALGAEELLRDSPYRANEPVTPAR